MATLHVVKLLCADEALDYGLPQITRAPALLEHVFEASRDVVAHQGIVTQASTRSKLSAADGQNEVFVDVFEQVSATFSAILDAGAELLHAELEGEIRMKSYLRGRHPEVRIVFNRELLIGEQPGQVSLADGEVRDVYSV